MTGWQALRQLKPTGAHVLLSLAVADALGACVEGWGRHRVEAVHGGKLRDFRPGSPYGFVPGEFTDDTETALCVLAALRWCQGRGLPATGPEFAFRVLDELIRWLDAGPRDVGGQTGFALYRARELRRSGRVAPETVGDFLRELPNEGAAGNACLPRAVALAAGGLSGANLLGSVTVAVSVTHPDPLCVWSSVILAAAIARMMEEGPAGDPGACWLGALRDAMGHVPQAALESAGVPADVVAEFWRSGGAAERTFVIGAVMDGVAGKWCEPSGFVVRTLQAGIRWGMCPNWPAAVFGCVSEGGDADGTGAVAGAIMGARGLPVPGYLAERTHTTMLCDTWKAARPRWQKDRQGRGAVEILNAAFGGQAEQSRG